MSKLQVDRRYFPTAMEQFILIQNMGKYFSYPERTPDRTRIAEEVATLLRTISGHWTYKSVRLWFNNNKNSTFCQNTNISKIPISPLKSISPTAQNYAQPAQYMYSPDQSTDSDTTQKIPSISEIDSLLPQKDRLFPKSQLPLAYVVSNSSTN